MKNKSTKRRSLAFAIIVIGSIALGQAMQRRCPERPERLHIKSAFTIYNLYPWPDAKIPFACQTMAFLRSPLAPKTMNYNETVLKEDGVLILEGKSREGVVTADISILDEKLFPIFHEDVHYGKMPLFANGLSLYVDGKKLKIGHIGYRGLDAEYDFATILDPFLWPGEHIGKIVILLPSGETMEYEWRFEITWW